MLNFIIYKTCLSWSNISIDINTWKQVKKSLIFMIINETYKDTGDWFLSSLRLIYLLNYKTPFQIIKDVVKLFSNSNFSVWCNFNSFILNRTFHFLEQLLHLEKVIFKNGMWCVVKINKKKRKEVKSIPTHLKALSAVISSLHGRKEHFRYEIVKKCFLEKFQKCIFNTNNVYNCLKLKLSWFLKLKKVEYNLILNNNIFKHSI